MVETHSLEKIIEVTSRTKNKIKEYALYAALAIIPSNIYANPPVSESPAELKDCKIEFELFKERPEEPLPVIEMPEFPGRKFVVYGNSLKDCEERVFNKRACQLKTGKARKVNIVCDGLKVAYATRRSKKPVYPIDISDWTCKAYPGRIADPTSQKIGEGYASTLNSCEMILQEIIGMPEECTDTDGSQSKNIDEEEGKCYKSIQASNKFIFGKNEILFVESPFMSCEENGPHTESYTCKFYSRAMNSASHSNSKGPNSPDYSPRK